MDIFQNKDGFFGKPNFASIQNHTREFWNLANKKRSHKRLRLVSNEKNYLPRKYEM